MNLVGYRFNAPTPLRWNTYITRLDYSIDSADKHTVFFRGNLQNDHENEPMPQLPGQAPATVTLRNNKGFAAGLTDLLSPTLVNTFRYGLTRQGSDSTGLQTVRDGDLPRRRPDDSRPRRNFTAIIPVQTIATT